MENASKALLIAAGILIAILILTIGIYLYTQFSNQSKEYNSIISATELQKFNSKFEVYVGRSDVTAQELISVSNLAKEYNGQVKIYLGTSLITDTPENFIKSKQDKIFSCTLDTSSSNPNPRYDEDGKIIKLTFTEN